jgi:hypothetical protein
MGAYNILRVESICPLCKKRGIFEIHFKYGFMRLREYSLGDQLEWGGNDAGVPGAARVLVQGLSGRACPNCHEEFIDFDIVVERDRIARVIPIGKDRVDEVPEGFVVCRETLPPATEPDQYRPGA